MRDTAGALVSALRGAVKADSQIWRRALHAGVHYGPDPWVRYSPPVFGVAFGATLEGPRRAVLATLRKIHGRRPPLQEMRDVSRVFANFAWSMTDGMLIGAGRGYHATGRPVGDWHVLSSAARGRGVIIATAHTAGWDVGGIFLKNAQPREVWVVMEREPNHAARQLHDAARERAGLKVVHVGDDPLASLPLLRHLRGGGVVALKFDRVHHSMRTRKVTFLGETWRVPEGPLSLASLSGAPIIPVLTRRLGFLEYEVTAHTPIYLPRRPSETQLDDAAQGLASTLEKFVRSHPTQWFRFKDSDD